ncbi:MAG TPA: hypothetical protein VNZ53_41520 [Steroidobacteraceae bacterium]|jgi:hypothetical protein|nr:hypothetical protein [Steroidobacteraceae bacterium]
MDRPRVWGLPRYATLLVVLALHMALLAALMTASRTQPIPVSANESVELLYLPPATIPKIRAKDSRLRRLSGDTAITMAPPVLDSVLPAPSPPALAADGNGSGPGVDWAAEARRAVHAFEIRTHQPPKNISVSGSPAEEHWWLPGRRHAGDQFKTASGDWIVWIDASCYQVATSAATSALGPMLPRTICLRESSARQDTPPPRR